MNYPCITVDFPWSFNDKLPGGRGASAKYDVISRIPEHYTRLLRAQTRSIMFFWRVAAMQREALDMVDAMGFVVKSELVWQKLTKSGKKHFGMGHYVRGSHEVCLICTKGEGASKLIHNHDTRSTFEAPVGEHSEKPDEFFRIVERLVTGPRLALFERKERPWWHSLGNELPAQVALFSTTT